MTEYCAQSKMTCSRTLLVLTSYNIVVDCKKGPTNEAATRYNGCILSFILFSQHLYRRSYSSGVLHMIHYTFEIHGSFCLFLLLLQWPYTMTAALAIF